MSQTGPGATRKWVSTQTVRVLVLLPILRMKCLRMLTFLGKQGYFPMLLRSRNKGTFPTPTPTSMLLRKSVPSL